mmetsp:Transcript_29008/g.75039  ORF Transcript_29008/g.75039 Transcript_29008/m.75039 type:complete len:80 (-) Transcript_29008:1815-2054(-)
MFWRTQGIALLHNSGFGAPSNCSRRRAGRGPRAMHSSTSVQRRRNDPAMADQRCHGPETIQSQSRDPICVTGWRTALRV